MSGLDRAGYKQISHNTDCDVITSTMSSSTCPYAEGWCGFIVISSGAAIGAITDGGMTGSSLISSGTTFATGTEIWGNTITKIKVSTDSTGHMVLAYRKVLL